MEEFRSIKGYEGIYAISDFGRVKSIGNGKTRKEKILSTEFNSTGKYESIKLYKNSSRKTFKIHQLVAMAFLNHIPNGSKLVINHKNFIRTDNRVKNLEITTQRNNTNKKHLKSSSKYTGVSHRNSNPNNKWRAQININGKSIELGSYINEIDAHNAYQKAISELNNQ